MLICANRPDKPGRCVCAPPDGTCERFRPANGTRTVQMPTPPSDDVRYIPLTPGRFAIVDAADYEEPSKHLWHWLPSRFGSGYAGRVGGRMPTVLMHRQIMNAPKGMVVDHIDGNGLNNRRSNLRRCTQQENMCNQRPKKSGTSGSLFKGVYYLAHYPHRPFARIKFRGKLYHLGYFDTEIEAAKAYDRKAFELQGEFAYLNFPEDYGRPPRPKPATRRPHPPPGPAHSPLET